VNQERVATRYRELGSTLKAIVALCSLGAIGVAVFNLFQLNFYGLIFTENGYYYILMAFLLPWPFVFIAANKKLSQERLPWYDACAALLAFAIPFYLCIVSYEITIRGWDVEAPDHVRVISLVLIILTMEAVRRSVGIALTITCVFFGLFPLFASHMPVPFNGVDFDFWRIASFHVMGSESFLGIPMRVVANLLLGFMIFAVALMATGGGEFFHNIAMSTLGHVRGGAAKVSIFSSALFGSISGSVTANVLTTGSITIPTMKKSGYPPHYAAAVEACASTGGVLMPPVMGAAAFIIAQFLAIPYIQVAIAAAIPSALYYLGLFVQADAFAAKRGLKGLPKETLPSFKQTLKEGWFYIIAIIILLWLLLYLGRVGQAPFYATAALFVLSMVRKETRLTPRRFVAFLENNARNLSELIAVMLGVGLIVGSLSMTGVAHGFSSEIIELSGGKVALLLFFGAITSFILGMGMSVTACYVLLAVLLAPALVSVGLYPLGVHLYVLYWGMISFITPPVAVAAIVAAGLAGADAMKTGFQAIRLGVVIFFIPLFFVLEPALLLHGSTAKIVVSLSTAVAGIVLLTSGIEGYLVGVGTLYGLVRPFLIIAGILLAYPHWLTSVIGGGMGACLILVLVLRKHSRSGEADVISAEVSGQRP
jgi:TRAP transporter 4TM/12TM fusion protein